MSAKYLERVMEIELAAFPEEPYTRRMFLELLDECGDLFIVARVSRRIVGYMVTCAGHSRAEVISIAVDPTCRARGAGTAMMRYTLKKLRQRGVGCLDLMVRTTSVDAIRFYEKFGFIRGRKARRYYQNGGDAWRMRKSLQEETAGRG